MLTAPAPAMEAALAPVSDGISGAAHRRASTERDDARRDADAAVTSARDARGRRLAEARAVGRAAGEREGAAALLAAHRQARGAVLAARRRAYDALRAAAASRLAELLTTPEGRSVDDRLAAVVSAAAGGEPVSRCGEAGAFLLSADAGPRRAELDLATLVDAFLPPFLASLEAP